MDSTSLTSILLFDAICSDLGESSIPAEARFNPFPHGIPAESEVDARAMARIALLRSAFSKTEVEVDPEASQISVDKFLIANAVCETWRPPQSGSPLSELILWTAKDILADCLYPGGDPAITMASIEASARFGPGASVGLGGVPSALYFKLGVAHHTCTSEFVRSWYESAVRYHPLREAAEMARQARRGRAEITSVGNLALVPKKYSEKRVVITEPSENVYFQLGAGVVIEGVLERYFNISLAKQPELNRQLAREGSINGRRATVDLRQSSDFLARLKVKWLLPKGAYDWLALLRTPQVRIAENDNRGKARIVDLHMFSTMGNGFTFPLQTLIYASIVLATYKVLGIKGEAVSVFGDDIVLPTQAYHPFCEALKTLGCVVNDDKSYYTGRFRESCGADYFDGVNVRGVYLKRYTTDQDLFSAYNRLALWSVYHSTPLIKTLALLLAMVRGQIPIVPPDEQVTAGIRTPEPVSGPNPDGLWEYSAYRPVFNPFDVDYWVDYSYGSDPDATFRLKNSASSGDRSRRTKKAIRAMERYSDGCLNEPAALLTLLAGGLRRSRIGMRRDGALRYRLDHDAKTPRWGYSDMNDGFPSLGSPEIEALGKIIQDSFDYMMAHYM